MRAVIQRVSSASLTADGQYMGDIQKGFVVLVGIENEDNQSDADWLCDKITRLRIFQDETDKMNLSLEEVQGCVMIVSQFTLFASTKKGNRPSFILAAKPEIAIPLYDYFIARIKSALSQTAISGIFGADMKITLVNDGPVTILLDTKNKE